MRGSGMDSREQIGEEVVAFCRDSLSSRSVRGERVDAISGVSSLPRWRSSSARLGPRAVQRGRRSRCPRGGVGDGGELHGARARRGCGFRERIRGTHTHTYPLTPSRTHGPVLSPTPAILPRSTTSLRLRLFLLPRATPKPMALCPCPALTFFSTVLCLSAPSALCKLARHAFPLAAEHVGALSDPTPTLVLAACVAHNNASPVLDFRR